MKGHRDLRLASAAAVLCALVAALVPWEPIRIVAALPLTLFLPGYAIVAVAFARLELPRPQLVTLSVAMSICALALGALVLNAFPFGLTTASWAVLLPLLTVACCLAAAARRPAPAASTRPRLPLRASPLGAALLGAALLVAVGAVVLAQRPLGAENALGYTALWVLPTNADQKTVEVGVISDEQEPTAYQLTVRPGHGEQPQRFALTLEPGQEKTFRVPLPAAAGNSPVTASLYLQKEPDRLYRRVRSWLPRKTTFP